MRTLLASLTLCTAASLTAMSATAEDSRGTNYRVTITNLTVGQTFTPFLVASHSPADNLLFSAGDAPGDKLAALAEGGDTAPLQAALDADGRVDATATSGGLLGPGDTVTVSITAPPGWDHISLAAMLIPTNDGFVSLQNVAIPDDRQAATYYAPAYDAGSEPNDELCSAIPGPVCGGVGGSPGVGGEGFVHIHPGIHGIGDLDPAERDWRTPVAKIVIRRAP
ncbi:MAG: spondin domain-containing protein [Thiogranum sp.]|jgi:hypothetical protein